jgi:hypothetical protein
LGGFVVAAFNRRHLLRDVLIVMVSGAIVAFSFATHVMKLAITQTPGYLFLIFAIGLVLALCAVILVQVSVPMRLRYMSRRKALTTGVLYGAAIVALGGGTGLLVASVGVWALTLWFFFGALMLSSGYRILGSVVGASEPE